MRSRYGYYVLVLATFQLFVSNSSYAFEFSDAIPCNAAIGAKPGPWCLEGIFTKGRRVAFLNDKTCLAVTGVQTPVSTEEDTFQGTALEQLDCTFPPGGMHSVVL